MQKLHPRSPYEKLGGYVHLPRLIDKAKLHRQGLLKGYNYKTTGFDKHLLAFLKLDGDAFEEAVNRLRDDEAILSWIRENGVKQSAETIEQWNEAMISRHPDTAAKKARFVHFLKEAGGDGRKDIRTYFDLIEFDEGRLNKPPASAGAAAQQARSTAKASAGNQSQANLGSSASSNAG